MNPKSATEQVKFWRDSALGDTELLHATYITHSFSRHTHDGYAIGVIESGVEEFTYRGATHRANAQQIVIVHPGEVHTGHAGVPSGWQYRMLYPDAALVQRVATEIRPDRLSLPHFPEPVVSDPLLAAQLCRLHRALEASELQLERESRFLWTLAQLIARYADDRSLLPIAPEQYVVRQVRDYLNANYADSISLDQLAHLANLKPLRLLRVFQRAVGLPPHAYLIQVRVARAKALLARGEAIAQVAADTGFTDQSHLNRHFKRLVGVTPKQYALGCRRSGAIVLAGNR